MAMISGTSSISKCSLALRRRHSFRDDLPGSDRADKLRGAEGIDGFADLDIDEVESGLLVDTGDGSIVLVGIERGKLTAGDFLFA